MKPARGGRAALFVRLPVFRYAPPRPDASPAQALVVGMSSASEARAPALRRTVSDLRAVAVAVGTGALIARTAALVSWVQPEAQPYTSPYLSDPASTAHEAVVRARAATQVVPPSRSPRSPRRSGTRA